MPRRPPKTPPRSPALPVAAAAFLVVAGLALVRLHRGYGLPAQPEPPPTGQPPVQSEAADAWLHARADRPMNPADPAWLDLSHHPGVVGTWQYSLPERAHSPAEAWAMALFGPDPAWLDMTATDAGLDMGLTAVLLQSDAEKAVIEGCPSLPAALMPLCDASTRATAADALDATLVRQLGSDDVMVADFALDAVCMLGGSRGVAIGTAARDGRAPGRDPRLQRLRGHVARACSLDEAAAVTELQALLEADWEVALVAATELARLEAASAVPALERLADRLGASSGDAVLVRYAAAVARGEGDRFADGVDGAGL